MSEAQTVAGEAAVVARVSQEGRRRLCFISIRIWAAWHGTGMLCATEEPQGLLWPDSLTFVLCVLGIDLAP